MARLRGKLVAGRKLRQQALRRSRDESRTPQQVWMIYGITPTELGVRPTEIAACVLEAEALVRLSLLRAVDVGARRLGA